MNQRRFARCIVAILSALLSLVTFASAADSAKTYKVFIYAGQSNAQGKAPIALMEAQAEAPETGDIYKHLRKDGKWIERDDVVFKYGAVKGPLKIGMGSYRTGGDFEFSSMMGDRFEEPVVIVKVAVGGASLCQSFRSPSAGYPSDEKLQAQLAAAQARAKAANEKEKKNDPLPTIDDIKKDYGVFYRQILADYKEVIDTFGKEYPALSGRIPELAGFVWFQGWNDQYGGQDEYVSNMQHFIQDVRKDLGAPNLPFVIVAMGQNGSTPASGAMLTVRDAQMAMNDVSQFRGNVKAFRSDLLVDKDAERLWTEKDPAIRERDKQERQKFAADDAYHYYGSPIWYHRIGHAAGEAMLELLKNPNQ